MSSPPCGRRRKPSELLRLCVGMPQARHFGDRTCARESRANMMLIICISLFGAVGLIFEREDAFLLSVYQCFRQVQIRFRYVSDSFQTGSDTFQIRFGQFSDSF